MSCLKKMGRTEIWMAMERMMILLIWMMMMTMTMTNHPYHHLHRYFLLPSKASVGEKEIPDLHPRHLSRAPQGLLTPFRQLPCMPRSQNKWNRLSRSQRTFFLLSCWMCFVSVVIKPFALICTNYWF